MKRALFLALLLAVALFISFKPRSKHPSYESFLNVDFSSNPPPTTGAPGEENCTDCHDGTTLPADGVVTFSFSGANNMYISGQPYTITISKPGSSKTGFAMTALDNANSAAGSFSTGPNTSIISTSGRNYIRHSTSSGVDSWTFTWNAPSATAGDVTFYYALNESNNNNSSIGDQIYLGSKVVAADIAGGLASIEKKEEKVKIFTQNNGLNLELNLDQSTKIYFVAQDISGKQLDYHSFGKMASGKHQLVIDLDEKYGAGVYVFSVFLNNRPYSSKIALP